MRSEERVSDRPTGRVGGQTVDEFVARGVVILDQQQLVERIVRDRRRARLNRTLDRWAER